VEKTTFVKYDSIAFQDFLAIYNLYSKQNLKNSLIDVSKIREFLFAGNKIKDKDGKNIVYPIKIFYIMDYDYIRNIHNSYFLFQSPSELQEDLEKLAKRIKIELKLKNIDTLFRIDPRYGLTIGTAKEAIDPTITQDKYNCFITLYVTNDPNHPEIALYEYVEKPYKKKYIEIFEKHNHCSPGTFKLLGFELSKFKKVFTKTSPQLIFFYNDIVEFGNSLIQKHKLENLTISLIYEDVSEREANECLLDKSKLSFFPSGFCKFFISIDELLQPQ
jgi:hypothetical protein